MPLFPLTLAPIYRFLDERPLAPLPLMILLNTAITGGVFLLGRQLFNARIGLAGAAISAFDSDIFRYATVVHTETLYFLLALLALLAIVAACRRGPGWMAPAGLLAGLTVLTRPLFFPLLLPIAGWLLLANRRQWRRGLLRALILIGVVLACLTPWAVRNYLVFGGFVPFTAVSCPPCRGIYNDVSADLSNPLTFGVWQSLPDPDLSSDLEISQARRGDAIAWVRDHPVPALLVTLAQPVSLWLRPVGGSLVWLTLPFYLGLLICAGFGLRRALVSPTPPLWLWLAVVAGMTGVALLTIGEARHRSFLQPFLDVLAGVALVGWWEDYAKSSNRPPAKD